MSDGKSAAPAGSGAPSGKRDWGKWRDYRSTVFSDRPDAELVACETCGRPCFKSKHPRCDGCWEVEHRLDGYLRDGGDAASVVLLQAISRMLERREVS
jgi:hypothetical protein